MSRFWDKVWNPFSTYGHLQKAQALENKRLAAELHEHSVRMKQYHTEIYEEQKRIAEELRRERRRNHFGDLFQTVPPRVEE